MKSFINKERHEADITTGNTFIIGLKLFSYFTIEKPFKILRNCTIPI